MSTECTHDCGSCSANCGERQNTQSLLEALNPKSRVKKVVAVVSGKGGVGKSLVTALMACEMNRRGAHVGVLDADVTGPSAPHTFGITQKATTDGNLIWPVKSAGGIDVMSINLLLENDADPVVWRGPSPALSSNFGATYSGRISTTCLSTCPPEPATCR